MFLGRRSFIILPLVTFAGCILRSSPKKMPAFQEALMMIIAQAQEIQITEHSSPIDAGVSQGQEYLYATRNLTAPEKKQLLTSVAHMAPALQDAHAACVPRFHHTFRFTDAKGGTSNMDVCFMCSKISWPGHPDDNPWAIYDTLGTFLDSIGLHQKADWDALAKTAAAGASK